MPIGKSELQYIRDYGVGLRAGTEAKNAAYALGDFGFHSPSGPVDQSALLDEMRWVLDPSRDAELLAQWHDHLYNTISKIAEMNEGRFNLVLLTGAPRTAERYGLSVANPFTKGDGKTFGKCGRVAKESVVDASRDFEADDIGSAVDWVIGTLADLAFMA